MNINKIILVLFLLLVGFTTIKYSFGLFTSAASNNNNIFTASDTFPTTTPTPTLQITPTPTITISASDIVINEVFNADQNKYEWIELYNRTSIPINVSGWKISDKNAFDGGSDDIFPTVSPIPAEGFAVVITDTSEVSGIPPSAITITLTNATIGSGLNEDGDAVILKNSSNTIVDSMNYGSVNVFFPSPPVAPPSGQSVARNPNGVDTNTTADWTVDSTLSLGVAN